MTLWFRGSARSCLQFDHRGGTVLPHLWSGPGCTGRPLGRLAPGSLLMPTGRPQRPTLGLAEAEAGYVMDIYDGAAWTEMDIEDLKAEIEHGRTIEEAAEFLCRAVPGASTMSPANVR